MVVHVPCLCYSRKGMELFYEKGEDKNGVLSYGIYKMCIRDSCTAAVSVQYVGATGGVTDKAIVDKMLAKYREDYK